MIIIIVLHLQTFHFKYLTCKECNIKKELNHPLLLLFYHHFPLLFLIINFHHFLSTFSIFITATLDQFRKSSDHQEVKLIIPLLSKHLLYISIPLSSVLLAIENLKIDEHCQERKDQICKAVKSYQEYLTTLNISS